MQALIKTTGDENMTEHEELREDLLLLMENAVDKLTESVKLHISKLMFIPGVDLTHEQMVVARDLDLGGIDTLSVLKTLNELKTLLDKHGRQSGELVKYINIANMPNDARARFVLGAMTLIEPLYKSLYARTSEQLLHYVGTLSDIHKELSCEFCRQN